MVLAARLVRLDVDALPGAVPIDQSSELGVVRLVAAGHGKVAALDDLKAIELKLWVGELPLETAGHPNRADFVDLLDAVGHTAEPARARLPVFSRGKRDPDPQLAFSPRPSEQLGRLYI